MAKMTWLTYKKNFKRLFGIDLDEERKKTASLSFKKLNENAVIPTYAHDGDIGMDLTAISVEYDAEHDVYNYHTGLAVATDREYGVFLFPRSSNRKTDSYLTNSVGVIDSFIYRGELILCFKNRTSLEERIDKIHTENTLNSLIKSIRNSNSLKKLQENLRNSEETIININTLDFAPYQVGDRVAQMVVFPITKTKTYILEELNETIRNTNGFGSTGN